MSVFGWLGAICFAFCVIPQAWKCHREGHARGLSWLFLSLWFLGEVCLIIATLTELGFISWLMFNYITNLFFLLIILYYKTKS